MEKPPEINRARLKKDKAFLSAKGRIGGKITAINNDLRRKIVILENKMMENEVIKHDAEKNVFVDPNGDVLPFEGDLPSLEATFAEVEDGIDVRIERLASQIGTKSNK